MTTKISDSVQERTSRRIAREQFDAFERRERLISMEERRERAAQLRLPTSLQTKLNKSRGEIARHEALLGAGFAKLSASSQRTLERGRSLSKD